MRTLHPHPGKFEGNASQMIARAAYAAVMDGGSSEDIGDVSTFGVAASLVEGKRYVFILVEDNQGFVDVAWYRKDDRAWRAKWERLSKRIATADEEEA